MASKKQIRATFRSVVFKRDRYRCAKCGKPGHDSQGGIGHKAYHPNAMVEPLVPLDAHHITDRNQMPNGGYVLDNGISLCHDGCHLLAEVFHQTGTPSPGFAPEELYLLIDSSFEQALQASERVV